jgi:hypothetical protein
MSIKIKAEVNVAGCDGHLVGEVGWYPGEEFKLLDVTLCHMLPNECCYFSIFHFQIAKFCIELGIDW